MHIVEKWTVRNIPEHTLEKLWEVKEHSPDHNMADLIEEAVEQWYSNLPKTSGRYGADDGG